MGVWRSRPQRTEASEALVLDAVRRTRAGDPDGLEFLYLRYAGDVQRAVAAVLHDEHGAEDVTHDVFAKLPAVLARYEERGLAFSGWLLRVAHNAALDELRRRATRATGEAPALEVIAEDRREESADVRAALRRVPRDQREVLLLRHLVGLTSAEIATRLGKSPDAVHCLHYRGRTRLRTALVSEAEAGPRRNGDG
jgi:RNA polymerase sigma-70 factor (ECF subfamily)